MGLVIVSVKKEFFKKKEKPVFISYVGLWDSSIINPLKVEFQRENPNVTIEYEQKDQTLYFKTLKNLISAEKAPDIFWWHSGWGPMLQNDLAPLASQVLSDSTYKKTYYPITTQDAKIAGTYRGIPLEFDGLALIYNKARLQSKHLKRPPKTWSELQRSYVPSLTRRDSSNNIITSAVALGTSNNISNFSEILGLLFFQNGVNFVKNGQVTAANSTAENGDNLGEQTLEFYTSFAKNPKVWDTNMPNSIRAFAQGKVAMIILPVYKIPVLVGQIKAFGDRVKFGVAPVPQPPDSPNVTWGSYWLSGVSAKSKNQNEAWSFINFLSQPENLRKIFTAEAKIRGIGRVYPRLDMGSGLRKDSVLSPYVAQAPYATSWYLDSDTHDGALNDKMIDSLDELVTNEVLEKGSTTSNLKTFAQEATGILSSYGVLSPAIIER